MGNSVSLRAKLEKTVSRSAVRVTSAGLMAFILPDRATRVFGRVRREGGFWERAGMGGIEKLNVLHPLKMHLPQGCLQEFMLQNLGRLFLKKCFGNKKSVLSHLAQV